MHCRCLELGDHLPVCFQCHLETESMGIVDSMRKPGRSVFSYKPGEPLADYKLYFDRADPPERLLDGLDRVAEPVADQRDGARPRDAAERVPQEEAPPAPKKPANADVNIWPSMPMLTTPERSPTRPTVAASTSGIAYRQENSNKDWVLTSSTKK